MQWIKTLTMFLALFLGSDALSAKSQPLAVVKHTLRANSSICRDATISQHTSNLSISYKTKKNSFLVAHTSPAKRFNKSIKYCCGVKRWKNIHLRYRLSQHNPTFLTFTSIEPLLITGQYSTRLADAFVISMHKQSNVIEPLE